MSSHSNRRRAGGKPPRKPRKDFPLYAHKAGRWAKKVKGKTVYFTSWREDPKGVAALELWRDQKDDLLAGYDLEVKDDTLTVEDLCFQFLAHKEHKRDNGELDPRTFRDYLDTCKNVAKVFGRKERVTRLRPTDFARLRIHLARTLGPVALRNEMQRVRSLFKYAWDEDLIPAPVKYGQSFEKPTKKTVRVAREAHRDAHGDRMFEAHEIRRILTASGQPLKAMVLLGANGGLGQTDLGRLPARAVDLDAAMLDYARPKTGVRRRVPLWPETVAAIREWLAVRPEPKNPADEGLLFLTVRGARCVTVSKNGAPRDAIGQRFNKVLCDLGLKRPRLGFYGLRHGFETVAGEGGDQIAVDAVMGHEPPGMAANYIERIGDDRLSRVVNHVRQWLFGDPSDTEEADPLGADRSGAPDVQDGEQGDKPRLRLFAG
jgi:integrase